MKWTIGLELTPGGNAPITYDIGTITRPIADLFPEEVGLTLAESQQLLRLIQLQIIGDQAGIRVFDQSAEDIFPCHHERELSLFRQRSQEALKLKHSVVSCTRPWPSDMCAMLAAPA